MIDHLKVPIPIDDIKLESILLVQCQQNNKSFAHDTWYKISHEWFTCMYICTTY